MFKWEPNRSSLKKKNRFYQVYTWNCTWNCGANFWQIETIRVTFHLTTFGGFSDLPKTTIICPHNGNEAYVRSPKKHRRILNKVSWKPLRSPKRPTHFHTKHQQSPSKPIQSPWKPLGHSLATPKEAHINPQEPVMKPNKASAKQLQSSYGVYMKHLQGLLYLQCIETVWFTWLVFNSAIF